MRPSDHPFEFIAVGIGQVAGAVILGSAASAGIGYFVYNRTQIGLSAHYAFGTGIPVGLVTGYQVVNNRPANFFSVEPYSRRYLGAGALTPYVGGRLIWQSVKAGGPAAHAYGARLSAGLAYVLGKRFIVDAELAGSQSGYAKE